MHKLQSSVWRGMSQCQQDPFSVSVGPWDQMAGVRGSIDVLSLIWTVRALGFTRTRVSVTLLTIWRFICLWDCNSDVIKINVFWDVKPYRWMNTDVLNELILSIFKAFYDIWLQSSTVILKWVGHEKILEDLVGIFDILLTVHHVMILGKWPTWRTNSFLCIYF